MSIVMTYHTSRWTRADALKVNENDPTTKQPLVPIDFPVMDDKLFIWDTMPLRTLDGTIVSVNGFSVIFTLTADRNPELFLDEKGKYDIKADWEDRHGRARICFWYSKTGKDWIFGGRVMQEGVSPTTREWAGTPILLNDRGDIDLYYTCISPCATICKVRGRITTKNDKVQLLDFDEVKPLFSADGVYYQDESQNPYWNFRDPSPFVDPKDGKLYMVFEGNVAGERGDHKVTKKQCGILPYGHKDVGNSRYQVGCIGLARALDPDGEQWEILPPLVTAVGVNDQLERPHFVFKRGRYYLFTISHKYTYADGLTGSDGVYGFTSRSLTGLYKPMNSSGLVLGNPPSQPFQTYSHYVMPNGLVTSFIDSVPCNPLIKLADGTFMHYRIGGTLAPTVKIELKDDKSYVVDQYTYGYIPPMLNVELKE